MKRLIYILFLFSACAVYAQEYHVETIDGKMVMQGAAGLRGMSSEVIYSNLLMWLYNNEAGEVKEKEFGQSLSILQTITNAQDPKTSYNTKLTFTVDNGSLSFVASEIVRRSRSGFTYSAVPFEKLQIEKKPKDKQYLLEFEDFENQILNKLFEYLRTSKLPNISSAHISSIKEGKVVVGMNETECILAAGKPINIHNSDNETQWMIKSGYYIFFKNGKVTSVVK